MSAPSNNDFRIAGALGLETEPTDPSIEEVLTQGLGFPLRPIATVPPTDAPDVGDIIAKGLPIQWMGNWRSGVFYPQGAFVRDGEWTAVALQLTLERPSPVQTAPATYGLPAYVPATQSNTSQVSSGNVFTFTEDGWIKELRVWVTELSASTNYRIIIVDITDPENPTTTTIEEPVLVVDQWTIVSLLDSIIPAGTKLIITLDALNSGADTNISGGWRFQGNTPIATPPPAQNWTVDNNRTNFRIDKTDLDGTDRGTELEGVIIDSTISVVETANVGNAMTGRVTSVIDQGTYMEYGMTLLTETGGGPDAASVTSVDIDVPIPLPTEYAEELLVWGTPPAWATVEGFLSFNGVDQAVPVTNAYGVDLLFEPAEISTDWDIVSFVG